MTAVEDIASLQEIRDLLKALPPADEEAAEAALERQGRLTKPAGSLGRLEELAVWLATWQGRHPPSVDRPSTAVFAGNHGIARQGVSCYQAQGTVPLGPKCIARRVGGNQASTHTRHTNR